MYNSTTPDAQLLQLIRGSSEASSLPESIAARPCAAVISVAFIAISIKVWHSHTYLDMHMPHSALGIIVDHNSHHCPAAGYTVPVVDSASLVSMQGLHQCIRGAGMSVIC